MPLIPRFIDTLDRLKELHRKKNDDYAGNRGVFYNFEFAEWLMDQFENKKDKPYANLVGTKLARLAVLLSSKEKPNNESIDDNFDDLIVYLTIWKCNYLERNRIEPTSQTRLEKANTV